MLGPTHRALLQQVWAGARALAFLTNPQTMLILLVLRRPFQNHYAKPRKTPEGFGFGLLDHMEREKERALLEQEH